MCASRRGRTAASAQRAPPPARDLLPWPSAILRSLRRARRLLRGGRRARVAVRDTVASALRAYAPPTPCSDHLAIVPPRTARRQARKLPGLCYGERLRQFPRRLRRSPTAVRPGTGLVDSRADPGSESSRLGRAPGF